MRTCLWFVAALTACGSPADSQGVEYGPRNQDWDGDGYARPEDCNDADPEAFPGAPERCNGLDDNCNAAIDEDIATTYYRDRDGDGYGAADESFDICWKPDGYVDVGGDCNDTDAAISPAATEICDVDGADEDCNGLANEADPGAVGTEAAYIDADNDGFGVGAPNQIECFVTPGLATVDGDCDDTSAARNPGAVEVCDPGNVDEDCDGLADDLDPEGPSGGDGWYLDADGDDYGDPATGPNWFCDGVPPGYVPNGLDCDDGEALAYPNHYEDCDDGIDNDCDGTPDDCGPIPAIDLGGAALIVDGNSTSSEMGRAVSSADLDGDGAVEILVGADKETTAYTAAGAVHVIPGTARGNYDVDDIETTVIEGGATNQWFGAFVVGMPDTDADGYGGLAAGTGGSSNDGVWIFEGPLGSSSVSQTSADAALEPGDAADRCGGAYAFGDLDDDGNLDHLLGCSTSASGGGIAFLVLGPVSGNVTSTDGVVTGASEEQVFGKSITALGDVDGDGTDDVAVGAMGLGSTAGTVFLVLGPDFVGADGDPASAATATFEGPDGESVGIALAGGDVNGDGYVDLFASAPTASIGGGASAGRAYGILGPLADGMSSAAIELDGQDADDQLSQSITANGDVNGDGFPDVLLGAPGEDHAVGVTDTGGAYLFVGPLTGGTWAGTSARARLDGVNSTELCGTSVALVPDLSGDGRADVLIGATRLKASATAAQEGGMYLVTSEGL